MRLCVINNIIMLLIIIVLGKISYNILRNKKNYETFTNSGWYLNHDGELCYESTCRDIAVLGSGDSGKICTIGSNTLDCEKIEEGALAEGDENGDDSENGNIGSNVPVVTYNNDQKKLEFSIGVNSVNISGDETSIFAVQSYDGWDRINSESYTTTDNDQLQNEISLIFYTAPNKKLTLGILNRDENGVLIEDNDGIYTSTTFEYNLGGTKDDVTVTSS